MGGSSSTTDTSQQQDGWTSLTQNQSQGQNATQSASTNPWAASMPAIQGILDKLNPLVANSGVNAEQQSGIDQLTANAQGGNPYASSISKYASDLFNGGGATAQAGAVQGSMDQLNQRLGTQADAGYSSLDDPKLRAALDQIQSDVSSQVNGSFAAAGRDFSGANQNALARGVTAAQAPLILSQFNQDRAVQQGAAKQLYDAGNTTSGLLAAMGQQALTNRGAGVTASGQALDANNWGANQLLQAGGLKQSLPTQALGLLAQIGIPIAGLGTTSSAGSSSSSTATNSSQGKSSMTGTSSSKTEKEMSPIEMIASLAQSLSALKPGAGK